MTGGVANELPIAGKYRPILELGRGGMAVVYLAVAHGPAGFNKLQVIKQLRPELAREPEQVAMFLNEGRIAARINHPNVVQVNEVGRDQGPASGADAYFMAMEYVDGQTLERITRMAVAKGGIPLRLHLKVIAEALAGLHAAHELKDFNGSPLEIVHRDVSPHNVLVGYEGEVKIVDFGIAKVAGSRAETRSGVLKGKVTYMAPEQFLGQKLDRRTDVFAAGVMLWQAVTARRLWGRDISEIEVYRHVIESRIPRPRDVDPTIPIELDAMVMKALATDPAQRYQSADELRSVIEDYLALEKTHPTARELGALVSRHFSVERQAIRTAIEERLRGVAMESTPNIPVLRSLLPPSLRDASTDRSMNTGSSSSGIGHLSSSLSEAPFLGSHSVSQPWYRSRPAMAAVAIAVTLAVVSTWRPWRRSTVENGDDVARATASAARASASSMAAPSASPGPGGAATGGAATLTELTVRATPAGAKIFIDGIEVEGNPFVGKFVRDGASHRVRAEAQGFASKVVRAEFSGEAASLDIALERQWATSKREKSGASSPPPAGGGAVAAVAVPSTPAAAPSSDAKRDDPWAKRKKPSFDSSDPWK